MISIQEEFEKNKKVFLSRADEVNRLFEAVDGTKLIFLWAPPKSGTTTLLREFAEITQDKMHIDVIIIDILEQLRCGDMSLHSADFNGEKKFFVVDSLEKVIDKNDINKTMELISNYLLENAKIIITGNKGILEEIATNNDFENYKEYHPERINNNEIVEKLVVSQLSDNGFKIDIDSAFLLCKEAGWNLCLIQSLVKALIIYFKDRPIGNTLIEKSELETFLGVAFNQASDYFDDLAKEINKNEKAPYEIVDLLKGNTMNEYPSLNYLGITNEKTNDFISDSYKKALGERCIPRKIASRYALNRDWVRAVDFYEMHLSLWVIDQNERYITLREAMNACYTARNPIKYTTYTRQYSQMIEGEERIVWLQEFLNNVGRLINELTEIDRQQIFDIIVQSVDTITRTGQVRLYLDDAKKERLVCRGALGTNSNECKKELVVIEDANWKIIKVYMNGGFVVVKDTQKDIECNKPAASKLIVNSSWIFPILDNNIQIKEKETSCVGVLCVDNPHHSFKSPIEKEKTLIVDLLVNILVPLKKGKNEADRRDLLTKVDKLLSLHKYLLTETPAEQIIEELLSVAHEIQPNLSATIIRMVQGYHQDRLVVEGVSPDILKPVFQRPELRSINVADSRANPNDKRLLKYIYDVNTDYKEIPALERFMDIIKKENVPISLGSLLSYRLEYGDNFMGVCNFYTNIPRRFVADEEDMISMIVKQAAVAIYTAKQLKNEELQREGLNILRTCISHVKKRSDIYEIKKYITQSMGKLFNADSATLIFVDKANQRFIVECTWPEDNIPSNRTHIHQLKWGEGVTSVAVNLEMPYVLSTKDSEWKDIYYEMVPDVKTSAAIPAKDTEGNVVWVLCLEKNDEDAFSQDDITLINAVVSQIPVAMDIAELILKLDRTNVALKNKSWAEVMGDSVVGVVHRVSNIASPVPGFTEDVMDFIKCNFGDSDDHEVKDVLNKLGKIHRYSSNMREMAEKLSRSGKKVERTEVFSLKEIAIEIAKSLRDDYIKIFKFNFGENTSVNSDMDKVKEIFTCLFENALKASDISKDKRIPSIEVSANLISDNTIHIFVSDSGNGVMPTVEKNVCRTIVESNWYGLGIGLFVSSRYAYALGGNLSLHKNSNTGATFRLEILKNCKVERCFVNA